MPGLAGRMSTVVKSKISRLLDRAEDPGETLDYGYQKQVELLQNVKKGIADVVTSKKRLQMQSKKLDARNDAIGAKRKAFDSMIASRAQSSPAAITLHGGEIMRMKSAGVCH